MPCPRKGIFQMQDIALSAGVRQNLLTLQSTADMMSGVQNKLATGLKVNSALDNPNSFFTASGLNARANDLGTLLDDMGQSSADHQGRRQRHQHHYQTGGISQGQGQPGTANPKPGRTRSIRQTIQRPVGTNRRCCQGQFLQGQEPSCRRRQ